MDRPETDDEELSDEQKIAMATWFLLNSPPGEIHYVAKDLQGVLSNEAIYQAAAHQAFPLYNKEQMLSIEMSDGSGQVLVSQYGEMDLNHFIDLRTAQVATVDHVKQVCTGVRPATDNELPSAYVEEYRAAIDAEVMRYIEEAFPRGHCAVYATTGKDSEVSQSFELTITISSAKLSPKNFCNGRWRSVWKAQLHGELQTVELKGHIKKEAFEKLKYFLSHGPILIVPDLRKPFEVHCDASGDCIGAVLNQEGHAVAFESRRLKDAELHASIYEKEILAVIHALSIWKHYLLGADFVIRTDHQSLRYFLTQRKISEKQIRWANFLSMFHFQILHTSGTKNAVADALFRRPKINAITTIYHEELETLYEKYPLDPDFAQIWNDLQAGQTVAPYSIKDDTLYHRHAICIVAPLRHKVSAHYFEEGNVQLDTGYECKDATILQGPSETALAVATIIQHHESAYLACLEDCYSKLSDNTFKELRRKLPVTRTLFPWGSETNMGFSKSKVVVSSLRSQDSSS
ncbi:hypothetical protein L7F22_033794 [Adiantum nelumboides]|nr:hypothetical protein [Adiantum nelumboides]